MIFYDFWSSIFAFITFEKCFTLGKPYPIRIMFFVPSFSYQFVRFSLVSIYFYHAATHLHRFTGLTSTTPVWVFISFLFSAISSLLNKCWLVPLSRPDFFRSCAVHFGVHLFQVRFNCSCLIKRIGRTDLNLTPRVNPSFKRLSSDPRMVVSTIEDLPQLLIFVLIHETRQPRFG